MQPHTRRDLRSPRIPIQNKKRNHFAGASASRHSRVEPTGTAEHFFRPLRVYAFDPSRGSGSANVMTIRVPYEPLLRGPIGARIAVVDYDGTRDRYYRAVDLDDPAILLEGGLPPSEPDPRFHQQMAYAVVSHTLRTFDRALGRQVRFHRAGRAAWDSSRLRVYPHAFEEANAYYARDLHALLFGYFPADLESPGGNIPGQPVFTCLSHDVLVHETTHAIVDGMREYFLEPSNRDTLAFHEAFADLIALLQHFTFPEPLADAIQRTGGRLYRAQLEPELETDVGGDGEELAGERNPLVDLAHQFGEALGTRRALRSAIGQKPDPRILEKTLEPHTRGAILVAAVFEAFFRVYTRRTRDLFRLAGVGPLHRGELHPDLAQRLCAEATAVAEEFLQLCIRAMEFCPAVDLTFGDFLRAMVTVHARLDSEDRDGCRDALVSAFASRGIYPPDVRSMTVPELVWKGPPTPLRASDDLLEALHAPGEEPDSRERIAIALTRFCDANREPLGLEPGIPVAVRGFHHAVRLLGAELEQNQDLVCAVTQTLEVPEFPGAKTTVKVRGGTTLVIRDDGRVRYAISKRLHARRQQAQLDCLTGHDRSAASLYCHDEGMDLRALHRGY